jgi:hypothetical protein
MDPSASTRSRFAGWLSPLVYLSSNWLSLVGVVLVTASAVSWVILLPALVQGSTANPYLGILGFLILPGVFVLGLILIPLGIAFRRGRIRRRGEPAPGSMPLTLHSPELRKIALFVGLTTVANLVIAGQWGYSAVSYMDSQEFCGLACHSVMAPEYTAYLGGTHSRVECIKCHAGSGATGFINAKLAGINQLIALATNTYDRPIPAPVHNMLPARETCAHCHSLAAQPQDRMRVKTHFGDDEKNTAVRTVLLMRVGAIHRAHLPGESPSGARIRFAADARREKITWVELNKDGQSTVFTVSGTRPERPPDLRDMDCLDCHNRPAHTFETPEAALDRALLAGTVSPGLPFARKNGVEILKRAYATREEAARAIPESFAGLYREPRPEVDRAAKALLEIYSRNVFPGMKVAWGTYPNHLGHTDSPGCFRCHDYEHTSPSGAAIEQDCNACHNLIAVDEPAPKILGDLGISP